MNKKNLICLSRANDLTLSEILFFPQSFQCHVKKQIELSQLDKCSAVDTKYSFLNAVIEK